MRGKVLAVSFVLACATDVHVHVHVHVHLRDFRSWVIVGVYGRGGEHHRRRE
jgi:hypothetical protein